MLGGGASPRPEGIRTHSGGAFAMRIFLLLEGALTDEAFAQPQRTTDAKAPVGVAGKQGELPLLARIEHLKDRLLGAGVANLACRARPFHRQPNGKVATF
jgi:hypothetical protein